MSKVGGETCPKCGDLTWYENDGSDIVQRCLCGLHKVVYIRHNGIVTIRRTERKRVILPRPGSKIDQCFKILCERPKDILSTREVADELEFTVSDASLHLMILVCRGLADRVENRRSKAGGSLWRLSAKAVSLMGIRK